MRKRGRGKYKGIGRTRCAIDQNPNTLAAPHEGGSTAHPADAPNANLPTPGPSAVSFTGCARPNAPHLTHCARRFERMAQVTAAVDSVAVSAPRPLDFQHSVICQFRDDALDGSLGEPHRRRHVPNAGIRMPQKPQHHVTVIAHKSPAGLLEEGGHLTQTNTGMQIHDMIYRYCIAPILPACHSGLP